MQNGIRRISVAVNSTALPSERIAVILTMMSTFMSNHARIGIRLYRVRGRPRCNRKDISTRGTYVFSLSVAL